MKLVVSPCIAKKTIKNKIKRNLDIFVLLPLNVFSIFSVRCYYNSKIIFIIISLWFTRKTLHKCIICLETVNEVNNILIVVILCYNI